MIPRVSGRRLAKKLKKMTKKVIKSKKEIRNNKLDSFRNNRILYNPRYKRENHNVPSMEDDMFIDVKTIAPKRPPGGQKGNLMKMKRKSIMQRIDRAAKKLGDRESLYRGFYRNDLDMSGDIQNVTRDKDQHVLTKDINRISFQKLQGVVDGLGISKIPKMTYSLKSVSRHQGNLNKDMTQFYGYTNWGKDRRGRVSGEYVSKLDNLMISRIRQQKSIGNESTIYDWKFTHDGKTYEMGNNEYFLVLLNGLELGTQWQENTVPFLLYQGEETKKYLKIHGEDFIDYFRAWEKGEKYLWKQLEGVTVKISYYADLGALWHVSDVTNEKPFDYVAFEREALRFMTPLSSTSSAATASSNKNYNDVDVDHAVATAIQQGATIKPKGGRKNASMSHISLQQCCPNCGMNFEAIHRGEIPTMDITIEHVFGVPFSGKICALHGDKCNVENLVEAVVENDVTFAEKMTEYLTKTVGSVRIGWKICIPDKGNKIKPYVLLGGEAEKIMNLNMDNFSNACFKNKTRGIELFSKYKIVREFLFIDQAQLEENLRLKNKERFLNSVTKAGKELEECMRKYYGGEMVKLYLHIMRYHLRQMLESGVTLLKVQQEAVELAHRDSVRCMEDMTSNYAKSFGSNRYRMSLQARHREAFITWQRATMQDLYTFKTL